MKLYRIVEYAKRPGFVLVSASAAAGLGLAAGFIAAAALGAFTTAGRIVMAICASALLMYALYGLAIRYEPRIIAAVNKSKLLTRIVDDHSLRAVLYACNSIVIETAFAVTGIVFWRTGGSRWYGISGIYYLMLAAIRLFVVLSGSRKKTDRARYERAQIRTYTVTGVALLVLSSVLATLFDILAARGSELTKSELTVYPTAVFAFFKLIFAAVGYIRARKNDDLMIRSLRSISAVSAAVSLHIFLTSLIASFPDTQYLSVFNGILSGYITTFTVVLAGTIIVRCVRLGGR